MDKQVKPISIFLSYAPEDEALLKVLETHLSLLNRQGWVSLWHHRCIVAGTNWGESIDEQLEQASIILLLVSPDFLASDYCYHKEMTRALQRHQAGEARVIPLLLRPSDWKTAPFAHLSPLPTNTKAITIWNNRDQAFADVAAGLRRAIEMLFLQKTSISHANLPVVWNIPYRRNPFFTGREDILAILYDQLHKKRITSLTQPQAISGLGGVGKTQTALEYAYRYQEDYQAVLWVKADTLEALTSDFMAIAKLLNVSGQEVSDQIQVVNTVRRWLEQNTNWLLILDNVESLNIVHDFLPKGYMGHILLTTRAQAVGTIANSIELEKMEKIESSLLLLRRSKMLTLNNLLHQAEMEDRSQAEAITTELDGLPLALDQAGAYIEETRCSLSEYLVLYRTRRRELLQRRGKFITDHPDSVASTLSLSIQKVEQINPGAVDLLRLCAYLDPDAIPEKIITEGASDLGSLLEPVAADIFLLNEAIELLLQFSLVRRNPTMKILTIHRLVQAILQESMDENTQRMWAERTVRATNRVFPYISSEELSENQYYLPHANLSAKLVTQWKMTFPEAANLLDKLGHYFRENYQGEKEEKKAEPFLLQALDIRKQLWGSEHIEVAHSLDALGFLYRNQGKYDEAEQLHQQALAIKEKLLSPGDEPLVRSYNNLALIYSHQGKYNEAEHLYQQALAILRQKPESEISYTLPMCLHNLATVYEELANYPQAEQFHQQALTFCERVLGPEDLKMAWSLNRLALFYKSWGKYVEAEHLYQRSLVIHKNELGSQNREVGRILYLLASTCSDQGKFVQAEPLYQEALAIAENGPSLQPRFIANIQLAFAVNSYNQGQYEQAGLLLKQATEVYIDILGLERATIRLEQIALDFRKKEREVEATLIEEYIRRIQDKLSSS